MFPNLQLRTQLLAFAGILCALLLAVGLTGLMGTRITHAHFVDTQADVSLADKVAAINYKVFDSRLHIALAQNGTDGEQMRKEGAIVAANIKALNILLDELAGIPAPPEESGAVEQFGKVVKDFTHAYLVPAVKAMEAGQADELRSLVAAQADRFYQPIKQGRERVQEAQKATVQAHREEAAASYRLTLAAVLLLSGLGLLISAVYAWQSVRTITQKTDHLRDTLQHIATRHDLTATAALAGKDELAEIASHLNVLLASIGTVLRSAAHHSQDAGLAGSRLLSQADEAQQAIEQQDRALAAGSSALGQVTEQTHRIAENMRDAARLADNGAAQGAHGAELVNRVAETMSEIATKVGDAGVKIEQLGEQSAKVDGIAVAIQEIAAQTNLLALNAAIEAARAGETGRGFAVVADEVRKLAERTQQATSEIQRTLQAIRAETVTATESMKHGREQIDAGIVQAQEAAAAINDIRELVVTVNQRIKEIDAAIQNQAIASESVSTRMQESAALSRRSADLSQSTRDTAHEVGDIGQKLRDAVATFRV